MRHRVTLLNVKYEFKSIRKFFIKDQKQIKLLPTVIKEPEVPWKVLLSDNKQVLSTHNEQK